MTKIHITPVPVMARMQASIMGESCHTFAPCLAKSNGNSIVLAIRKLRITTVLLLGIPYCIPLEIFLHKNGNASASAKLRAIRVRRQAFWFPSAIEGLGKTSL